LEIFAVYLGNGTKQAHGRITSIGSLWWPIDPCWLQWAWASIFFRRSL